MTVFTVQKILSGILWDAESRGEVETFSNFYLTRWVFVLRADCVAEGFESTWAHQFNCVEELLGNFGKAARIDDGRG